MKRISAVIVMVLLAVGLTACARCGGAPHKAPAGSSRAVATETGDNPDLLRAIREHASDRWVGGTGMVSKLLKDDTNGKRHQRFIVRLKGRQTLLMAHNIDLAPRVPVAVGDTIDFKGEFEWNKKGGVVHWTHHDPNGRGREGWIRHKNRLYQ